MDPERGVVVVGAGIGGLTAAALLAKRGLDVLVLERCSGPGGSCSAFRRRDCTLDLGAAMLFGFGERGYNPHRFVLNELEEEFEVYRHEAMYRLWYGDRPVVFWPEPERFLEELGRLFPRSIDQVRALYRDLEKLYDTLMSASSVFLSPSETPRGELARGLVAHPLRQARLLTLLSKSARTLMRRHIKDEEVYRFFDKLTSTYAYTTIDETPALLAATMFVENHVGGSYYPAGSPMMLAARLEKALEKYSGSIRYGATVARILVEGGGADGAAGAAARVAGVELESGERIGAKAVVYGGTVLNLYERLLPSRIVPPALLRKVRGLEPSFPSSVLYGAVDAAALPPDAFPVEMLIGNPERIDASDLTLYFSALEDPSLAPPGTVPFMLIGPAAGSWPSPFGPDYRGPAYQRAKEAEAERMLGLVGRRFPRFRGGLKFSELGTPSTIERYLLKNGGAVAGPKQSMGQELLNRQGAATFLPGLYMCGESTTMGTGTPAVTISGISAADLVLRDRGLPEYRNRPMARQYVSVIPRGRAGNRPRPEHREAALCRWCEDAPCREACPSRIDVMGIMRRLEAGNVLGAGRRLRETSPRPGVCAACAARPCLAACRRGELDAPVAIPALLGALEGNP